MEDTGSQDSQSTPASSEAVIENQTDTSPAETDSKAPPPGDSKTEPNNPDSGKDAFFDPKNLPPELLQSYKNMQAAFTKKTQEIAAVKDKARAFDELVSNRDFQNWYTGLTRGEQRQVDQRIENATNNQALTDEQYQDVLSDKNKFLSFINQMTDAKMMQLVVPTINQLGQEMTVMKREKEINDFASSHPDFWELDAQGLIEPVLMKYRGIGIDDAYRLAKSPFLEQEAIQKAHGVVQGKKNSATEKPGLSRSSFKEAAKFKDRSEAMRAIFEAAKSGREIPEIEIA